MLKGGANPELRSTDLGAKPPEAVGYLILFESHVMQKLKYFIINKILFKNLNGTYMHYRV